MLNFYFQKNIFKRFQLVFTGQSSNGTKTPTIELPHYKLIGAQIHPQYANPTSTVANKKNSEKLSYENYLDGWKRLGTTDEASKNSADSAVFEGLFEGEFDFVDNTSLKGLLLLDLNNLYLS